MRSTYPAALSFTLQYEGGYVNHPDDPGGHTMKGVTKATYEDYLGRPVTVAELKAIPDAHVEDIYERMYWNKVRGDSLPVGLDGCVFDFGVNSGPSRAAKYLQKMVGTTQDGIIGPMTLNAVNAYVSKAGLLPTIKTYNANRLAYLKRLKNWKSFGKGWTNRVNALDVAAKKWAVPGSRGDG